MENKPAFVAVGWVGLEAIGRAGSTIYPGIGEPSFSPGVDEGIGPCQRSRVRRNNEETMKKKNGSLLVSSARTYHHINTSL